MLTWLAKKFERNRAKLQARLENSLQSKVSGSAPATDVDWQRRGNEFLNKEMLADAEACYRKGILADARDAGCFSNLGYVLVEQGRREEAERMLVRAIGLNPADSDAQYLLGNLARGRHEWTRAIACYSASLAINPDFAHCRRDLCLVLVQMGQDQAARKIFDQGPAFDPETSQYHYFKGSLHLCAGEFSAAMDCFKAAKHLSPRDPAILISLGTAQIMHGDVSSALDTGRQILTLQPQNSQGYELMAISHQFTGRNELAIESYRTALQLNPQSLNVHQNLLLGLSYLPGYSPAAYLLEAQECGTQLSASARPYTVWLDTDQAREPRALRVGFVSGDLNNHPVCMFLENVLPFLDPAAITCIAYSNSATEDFCTARLKSMFSEWTMVARMPDHALAEKIHSDRIDVLLDLSGHTAQNRLAVFAWRPAPVQASWLGYWASTGLTEMDYILVDKVSVPEDDARFFSEGLWYLPQTRFCFCPPASSDSVSAGDTPALRTGYITFGSFQSLSKFSDRTLAVWAQLLSALPLARLRLQSMRLSYPECTADMRRRLQEAHIDLDRVDMHGETTRDAYLGAYAEVDFVLDTFPFTGGTTTAEALWMGVPTVTLSGNTLLARQGESMLRCVGLADWVASDEQQYIALALQKAGDLPSLNAVRASLRSAALRSPLFDGSAFAKNLAEALQEMARKRPSGATVVPMN